MLRHSVTLMVITIAVLLKTLTYKLSCILQTNLGTFDNNAKSCYDQIVNGLAMVAARRLGMPDLVIAVQAGVLAAMKYLVKTTFGVSSNYIQSSEAGILFGTGQGSRASLAVWLTLSVILLLAQW